MEDNPLEASASPSGTRGGDAMSRQESMVLFTKLDDTMSSLVGIVSQLAAGQGASMASDPRAAMGDGSSRPGGESLLSTNEQVGQGLHPATAPPFLKVAAPQGSCSGSSLDLGAIPLASLANVPPVLPGGHGGHHLPPPLAHFASSALPPVPGYLVGKIARESVLNLRC